MIAYYLHHRVTIWKAQAGSGGSIDPGWAAPVSVDARWEERSEVFYGVNGQEERSRVSVFLLEDVALGDRIGFGESAAATPPSDALPVRDFKKMPDLSGEFLVRRALL